MSGIDRHASRVLATVLLTSFAGSAACAQPLECHGEALTDDGLAGDVFYEVLAGYLENAQPKGGAFAVAGADGTLRASAGCGLARDERRDRVAFSPDTFDNWGSVAKVITAAATLHAVDRTAGASLDDPFGWYLPARWQEILHPDHDAVTIRMLLQHKGGFAHDGEVFRLDEDGDVVDLLEARLQAPSELAVGVRSYSNLSPMLLHFVVAWLSDPAGMAVLETELDQAFPGDEFSREINLAAARTYVEYTRRHVLDAAGVEGSCNITDFPDHAFSYASGNSRNDGDYPRSAFGGEHTDECSAGGWVLSAKGMLALLVALEHDRVVSPSSRALMENMDHVDDRLGWSQAEPVAEGTAFCHGGAYPNVNSAVCSFPDGSQAVVNVNSGIAGGATGLLDALVEGYELARR